MEKIDNWDKIVESDKIPLILSLLLSHERIVRYFNNFRTFMKNGPKASKTGVMKRDGMQ